MKTLSTFSLIVILGLSACDSGSSTSSSGASVAPEQSVVISPVATPTPTVIPLTINQKMRMLSLSGNFTIMSTSQQEIMVFFNSNSQYIQNVNNDSAVGNNTMGGGINFTVSQLNITSGQLDQTQSTYLSALGTVTITDPYNIVPTQYQNIPTGTFYFSVSNNTNGPFSSFGYNYNGTWYVSLPCGTFELYTDAQMTQRVALLGNNIACGLQ